MTRRRRSDRGGFTLMETTVTIMVMGVVAALGYVAFATLIDKRAHIRVATAETEHAAALRATLEDWFARSFLADPGMRSIMGVESGKVGGPSKDMFAFITRAPTPSMGWATVMLLFIDDNPATPERGLTVRCLAYSSGEGAPWLTFSNAQRVQPQDEQLRAVHLSPVVRELDSRVVGLRVEFLDQKTRRWYRAREAGTIEQSGVARITLEGTPSAPLPRLLQLPFLISRADQGRQ